MQAQYEIAFSIFFKHNFFADGNLKSLVVKPTNETNYLLRKAGALFKPFLNGLHVLYETNPTGEKRSREAFLQNGYDLHFLVKNMDTAFYNYTLDFTTDISGSYFFFTNTHASGRLTGLLHPGQYVGPADMRAVDKANTPFIERPFALIHIKLKPDLAENLTIAFTSVASYWCYVLSQSYLQDLARLAVIDKNTKAVFRGPDPIKLPQNRPALIFYSSQPIVQQERPVTAFQLVEEYDPETRKYKIVLPTLPRPNQNHISTLQNIPELKEKKVSYIFI